MSRSAAVDTRVALRTVVVDELQRRPEELAGCILDDLQGWRIDRLVEALHHQLRTVAVDRQAGCAFLAAMEKPIAIGVLLVQLLEQRATAFRGGAQRLV